MGNKTTDIVPSQLNILVTDKDKYGHDITEMSDFMDRYALSITENIKSGSKLIELKNIPFAETGILGSLAQISTALLTDDYILVPDFASLPTEIAKKLKEGIYSLGESRQVDGNLRPVILDEEGVRIKDLTLRKARKTKNTQISVQNLYMQLQLKQISDQLDEIAELQSFQIDKERATDIFDKFFIARDYILKAQNSKSKEAAIKHLEMADQYLNEAEAAVYSDMHVSSKHLEKATRRVLLYNEKRIHTYMKFLTEDLQTMTLITGMHLQVLDRLKRYDDAKVVEEKYFHELDFFFNGDNRKEAPAMLIHEYYPYTEEDMNKWYDLREDVIPMFTAKKKDLLYIAYEEESEDA